jgi:hypothetical protein
MKDNTELEDEDGSELCGVCLRNDASGFPVLAESGIVHMVALVAEVVLTTDVGRRWWCLFRGDALALETVLIAVAVGVAVRVIVAVIMASELGVAHGHQLQEEHDEGGHEGDCLGPWVSV